jgi:hypothetical protein
MRIGVAQEGSNFPCLVEAKPTETLAVARASAIQGNDTYIINSLDRHEWWDDVTSMKEEWKDQVLHWKDIEESRCSWWKV